jgi:hypothetical protein
MSEAMSEEEIYKLARKRVQDKKDFFVHFCVYIVVNAMLVAIWAIPAVVILGLSGRCWSGVWASFSTA